MPDVGAAGLTINETCLVHPDAKIGVLIGYKIPLIENSAVIEFQDIDCGPTKEHQNGNKMGPKPVRVFKEKLARTILHGIRPGSLIKMRPNQIKKALLSRLLERLIPPRTARHAPTRRTRSSKR